MCRAAGTVELGWIRALAGGLAGLVALALFAPTCAPRRPELASLVDPPPEAHGPRREAAAVPEAEGPRRSAGASVTRTDLPGPQVGTRASIPYLIKVGLATDLEAFELACCSEVRARAGERELRLAGSVVVRPETSEVRAGRLRLQVAALKDEQQAGDLAQRLALKLATEADSVFDAESDLYRVRVGAYSSREDAESAREKLERLGIEGAWIAQEGAGVAAPAFAVESSGASYRLTGRWLELSSDTSPLAYRSHRYRGKLLLYVNDRGDLNLINALPLDDYLKGVVPREMGPELYGEIEALKAQAVAARSYTLRNLGEFGQEGYDICATPRCQVYGGLGVEHELSNLAISETAGQVLLHLGEPADALYSSACGGHTENVEVVFPLKRASYLRGVPCVEAGVGELGGGLSSPGDLADVLMRRLAPVSASSNSVEGVAGRLRALAQLAGLDPLRDRLASLERLEVQRFVTSIFDLALDGRLSLPAHQLSLLSEDPATGWGPAERRLALLFGAPGGSSTLDHNDVGELLLALGQQLDVLSEVTGTYLEHDGDRIRLQVDHREVSYRLASEVATFKLEGGRFRRTALSLLPGDPLGLFVYDDQALVVAQREALKAVAPEHTSGRRWSRFRSEVEIRNAVRERYPGFELRGLEVVARGVSGRVARLRLLGEGSQELLLEGLVVRWTLGLPDTLFTAKRLRSPPARTTGWLFQGRGWGHGVGLCQIGAYGMALRGHEYRDILDHYYRGLTLARLRVRASS